MKGKKEIASPARLTIPSGISRNTSVHRWYSRPFPVLQSFFAAVPKP